ncbi:MAG: NAD(P)H-hydrate dehydratase [Patescibacteria group bacterium]
MFPILKRSGIHKLLPRRDEDSHKGDNGRVLIIGGSQDYFGAPVFAGLGSLYSGADLTYILVPECNFDVTRSFYPDFIVRKYPGFFLNPRAIDEAVHLAEQCDAVLIGPGIGSSEEVFNTIIKILARIHRPVILDADALNPTVMESVPVALPSLTITPHHGEMERLLERSIHELDDETREGVIGDFVKKTSATVLLKGQMDMVVGLEYGSGEVIGAYNVTGHPGMTVGGTGDVLAGIVTSMIAQGVKPFPACSIAAFANGLSGENVARQKGNCFSATDVALELPYVIAGL